PDASSSTRSPSRITVWSSARSTLIFGFSSIFQGYKVFSDAWQRQPQTSTPARRNSGLFPLFTRLFRQPQYPKITGDRNRVDTPIAFQKGRTGMTFSLHVEAAPSSVRAVLGIAVRIERALKWNLDVLPTPSSPRSTIG